MSAHPAHRGTIFVEDARILSHQAFPGRQYVLRLAAPQVAARATAGSFVHVAVRSVDPDAPAAVDHARRSRGRLDRTALQDPRPGPVAPGLAARRRHREPARPDRPGLPSGPAAAARAADRRRRRHSADGVPRRGRCATARPKGSGRWRSWVRSCRFRSRAPFDDDRAGHARGRDRVHAAARGVGRAEPADEQVRISRVPRRLRHRPCAARGCRSSTPTSAAGRWRSSPAARRRC